LSTRLLVRARARGVSGPLRLIWREALPRAAGDRERAAGVAARVPREIKKFKVTPKNEMYLKN
jgi:hypothetical protein